MNILFVFDDGFEVPVSTDLGMGPGDKVYLFPLTSKALVKESVMGFCAKKGCAVVSVNTADKINSSSGKIRDRYLEFIAKLPGMVERRGKGLKEAFALDAHASLWWFSLIAEKNTYKSDAFFRLAQLDAIIDTITDGRVGRIIYAVSSKKLDKALSGYSAKNGIRYSKLSAPAKRWPGGFLESDRVAPYIRHLAILARHALRMSLKTAKIKLRFAGLKRPGLNSPLTIVSYYPNIDEKSAGDGVFRNRFWAGLQESLEKDSRDITWILLYVPNNSVSFEDSMRYAAGFIKNGYSIFFLEEFNSVFLQVRALWRILKSGFRFAGMEGAIRKAHVFGDYNFYELLKEDWYSSFAGSAGYNGILYYMIFSSVFAKTDSSKWLYPCEMHAWEKALILANRTVKKDRSLYAYQSGTVSRMLLNYFNHPSEISDKGAHPMPRPDKIICNGSLPFRYMAESGWPAENLIIGEAIRYLHLKEHIKTVYSKKRIVLLALSISPEESNSILTLANEALGDMDDVEVWVKPHPFLDVGSVLDMAGLTEKNLPFAIKKDPIERLLPDARVIIAGESGVTIEALAFGCEVVTVSSPEWINMSPLRYEKSDMVKRASSKEELRKVVREAVDKRYEPEQAKEESTRILNDFFNLENDSRRPARIMELLEA